MTEQSKPAVNQPAFIVDEQGHRVRTLAHPIKGNTPSGMIHIIKLRKPKYREIMTLGDPSSLLYLENSILPGEDIATIARYVDALSLDQDGAKVLPALLEQLDYVDALALKDAVLDFFKVASGSTASVGASAGSSSGGGKT